MGLSNALGSYVVDRGGENLPAWDGVRRGHYEVWYLTFNVPVENVAFWLRYTLEAPDHGEPFAELWGHFFDGANPGANFGLRQRSWRSDFRIERDRPDGQEFFRIGNAVLDEGRASGSLEREGHSLRWDLQFEPSPRVWFAAPALLRPFLGRKRTTWCVPNPDIRYTGTIEVDGRTFRFDQGPGQQGHLYGRQHSDRWGWLHCNTFDGRSDAAIQGVSALMKLGGLRRMVTAVYVRYQGEDYICNAFPGPLTAWSEHAFPTWRFRCQARGTEFRGTARGDPAQMLQVRYEDPDGTPSFCSNTELGSLELEVYRGGKQIDVLRASNTAHVEFGQREQRTDVSLCPGP